MGPEGTDQLVATVEGLLFAADRPLTVADLHAAIDVEDLSPRAVGLAVGRLVERHRDGPDKGFVLAQVGERFQFRTTSRVTEPVARLTGLKPMQLSRAAMEALAIVAYKQPCTRADVERVRGVDSGGVVRALLDRKLLRIAGRRNVPGRPIVYATSPHFLDRFGLGSLGDLPSLQEFTQLGAEDLEAAADLLDEVGEKKQVTFAEYATRRALSALDDAVDRRLEES